ncbi:hypothetical protein ACFSKW_24140 [Nonomuraea mangrovi]|uniref:WXG100 family type VII secretion target n=1 Tax=Nonomuraea mangrovi TaxID=2316207 RepID=A0ABW4SY36_9ACTN
MNGAFPGLMISRTELHRGLSEWNVNASDMETAYEKLAARIKELNAAAPWGGGTEGRSFQASYMQNDAPNTLLTNGDDLVHQIADLGPTVFKGSENVFGTDKAIEDGVRRGATQEV